MSDKAMQDERGGDVALKERFSADDLEFVYLHLQSLQTFPGLATRLAQAG